MVENLNDGSFHRAMIRWAARKWASGRIPLDGWFSYLTTGSPALHEYQSFPHIVSGFFAVFFGGDRVYSWSLYLLLALWPISVYIGARLLGWDLRTALAAALVASLVSSLPGYGYEFDSYTFGGLGLWSQLWGMWLLPLALGLTWRAVHYRSRSVRAAAVLSLTIVAHIITGYFALLALGVWWLAGLTRASLWRRLLRTVTVGAAALAAGSWLIVPAQIDGRWIASRTFQPNVLHDSIGAQRVISLLLTGRLFDRPLTGSRFPVVTILVLVGLLVCAVRARRDARARALLGLSILSFILFSGRPTFGFLLDRIPGSGVLLFHRYVLAVHMTGILLAGVGASWLASIFARELTAARVRLKPTLVLFALVLAAMTFLMPALLERARYGSWSARLIRRQAAGELRDRGARTSMIQLAKRLGGGRIYAGAYVNKFTEWGRTYDVGYVPAFESVLNQDADGIGFVWRVGSMITHVEPYFDERSAQQMDVFGVRYLLMPKGRTPLVAASIVASEGNHVLWLVPRTGYVSLVDTIEPITSTDSLRTYELFTKFLRSLDFRRGLYPTVAYLGQPAAKPTASRSSAPSGPPGSVTPLDHDLTNGVFRVRVAATRTSAVMLKASYHGRWRVRLDGRAAPKYMVAPGYPAITVSPGVHYVEFRYMPISYYPWLFALGALALIVLHLGMHPLSRRRWLDGSRKLIGKRPGRVDPSS